MPPRLVGLTPSGALHPGLGLVAMLFGLERSSVLPSWRPSAGPCCVDQAAVLRPGPSGPNPEHDVEMDFDH